VQVLLEQCGVSLKFKGALDINTAEEVRGMMLEHMELHGSAVLDLSLIECCDAAGAQLLIALKKSTESSGKPFRIATTSVAFVRDCASIGIHFASSMPPANAQNEHTDNETKQPRRLAKKKSTKKAVETSHA
jgi:anti-anti-sigma regulatory factor